MAKSKNNYKNPVVSILTGIKAKFVKEPPVGILKDSDSLDGKTVLVDGASSGLGLAIATECARRGAHLIMACRSGIPEKGERIKKLTGNPNVEMVQVDFSDRESVRQLASGIRHPLDLYICNAAIVPKESRRTKDGFEEMFMVNYLSKFMFINSLIEKGCFRMPASGLPRIIIVSSESHRNPEAFDWDGFGQYKEYGMKKTVELYGYYKLLLTTFARELSRKLNPGGQTNISVFSLCPGPVNSNIAREAPKIFKPLMRLIFSIFFQSPKKASFPVIYLATSPDLEGKPFEYLFKWSRVPISDLSEDGENGRKLWECSVRAIHESPLLK